MGWEPKSENEILADILYMHLEGFVGRLRKMPEDKLDFTFDPAAPSARTLAIHAWQWLICDRCHIQEPDALKHPDLPPVPQDQQELCDALLEEAKTWREMVRGFTPEQLAAPRKQFNDFDMNVRAFVGHMVQNCIYKHGQFSTIYFALGLDGTEPYKAPFPVPIYAELRAQHTGE